MGSESSGSRVRRPSEVELKTALEAAERMRIRGLDPHYLAHCLLYLWERAQTHEQLLRHADRYLRFGMDEQELAKLRQAVERLREQSQDARRAAEELPI